MNLIIILLLAIVSLAIAAPIAGPAPPISAPLPDPVTPVPYPGPSRHLKQLVNIAEPEPSYLQRRDKNALTILQEPKRPVSSPQPWPPSPPLPIISRDQDLPSIALQRRQGPYHYFETPEGRVRDPKPPPTIEFKPVNPPPREPNDGGAPEPPPSPNDRDERMKRDNPGPNGATAIASDILMIRAALPFVGIPGGIDAADSPTIVIGSREAAARPLIATPDIRPPPYPPRPSTASPPTIEPHVARAKVPTIAIGENSPGPYIPPTHPDPLPPSLPARSAEAE